MVCDGTVTHDRRALCFATQKQEDVQKRREQLQDWSSGRIRHGKFAVERWSQNVRKSHSMCQSSIHKHSQSKTEKVVLLTYLAKLEGGAYLLGSLSGLSIAVAG